MKSLIGTLLVVLLFVAGCGKSSDSMTNEEKISGQSEKTWKATRESNAQGENDKLTRQEKKESITFSRDGNVKMSNQEQVMGGTWSFIDNTLSLQFNGTNVTENFKVIKLSEDRMQLLAGDGSTLTLEAQ